MLKARVGKPAPQFGGKAVIEFSFKEMHSSDFEGSYMVLFIYSADFGYVCPTEVCAMNDAAGDFQALDCNVIVASTDSHFVHFAWLNTPREKGGLGQLQIPILSDITKSIGKSYGVYDPEVGSHLRGTFIIDRKGVLRHASISDLTVGREPDEILRLVQACQHVDATGQHCPVNWKPGNLTIKPDMRQKLEYFEAVYMTDEDRAEEAEKEAKRKAKEAKAKAKELEQAQAAAATTETAAAPTVVPAQDAAANNNVAAVASATPDVPSEPSVQPAVQSQPTASPATEVAASSSTAADADVVAEAPAQPEVVMVDVGTQAVVTAESGTQTSGEAVARPASAPAAPGSGPNSQTQSKQAPIPRAASATKSKACSIL